MLLPSVAVRVRPRAAVSIPNVATNGGTRPTETTRPFIRPQPMPASSPTAIAPSTFRPAPTAFDSSTPPMTSIRSAANSPITDCGFNEPKEGKDAFAACLLRAAIQPHRAAIGDTARNAIHPGMAGLPVNASARPTPDNARTEPIDRSMPPVKITNDMPTARTTLRADCCTTSGRFPAVQKMRRKSGCSENSAQTRARVSQGRSAPPRRRFHSAAGSGSQ